MAKCMFENCTFVFADLSEFSKSHRRRFIKKTEEYGGRAYDAEKFEEATYLIVGSNVIQLKHELLEKLDLTPSKLRSDMHVVRITWFQECLKQKQMVPCDGYELLGNFLPSPDTKRLHARRPQINAALAVAQRDLDRRKAHPNRPFGHWSTLSDSLYKPQPSPAMDHDTLFRLYKSDGMQLAITRYHCYNCGASDHGARFCPKPLRGTNGNDYDPAKCPYIADIPKRDALRSMPISVRDKFLCARKHPLDGAANPNAHIIDELERLVELVYEPQAQASTGVDRWKAMQTTRTITMLRGIKTKIVSTEGLEELPFIGQRAVDKIEEILEEGGLARVRHATTASTKAQEVFRKIYGVGRTTARDMAAQGLRSLEDLRKPEIFASLTPAQQVGVTLYDDLNQRIPRAEVDEMITVVTRALGEIDPEAIVQVSGSYARGKQTCGDVDFLLTHADPNHARDALKPLMTKLHRDGFITHDLTSVDHPSSHTFGGEEDDVDYVDKYMGIAKLPGRPHRRVDFIVVPPHEWALALLYFSGSGIFNRSMRLMARKNNMGLNQRHLAVGVKRKGETKLNKGYVVPCMTEEDVFAILGIEYQPCHLRNA
eukprot:TRINITY_DN6976_c0_g1_i1.p1 TRINITY_DN6976_c0_g1~~TRINITY_DN6976_c0_g1_i1.p1  ORF type:complete len:598 (+),score=102.79 TRINITY_DN6976_c0_g1_i1:59-1852(+)